ncbi:MAG: hypothetical protein NTW17_00660 [Candidatus Pacearchaeota archaeon]|nr:hypothetical protein [Candidatus Pacearchaeota archaeon]
MIIKKFYDKNGKLRIVKNEAIVHENSIIRFKILNKSKEWPCCDFHGKCTGKAYAEVYPFLMKNNKRGWSYLCRRHYYNEQKRLKWKLPVCLNLE